MISLSATITPELESGNPKMLVSHDVGPFPLRCLIWGPRYQNSSRSFGTKNDILFEGCLDDFLLLHPDLMFKRLRNVPDQKPIPVSLNSIGQKLMGKGFEFSHSFREENGIPANILDCTFSVDKIGSILCFDCTCETSNGRSVVKKFRDEWFGPWAKYSYYTLKEGGLVLPFMESMYIGELSGAKWWVEVGDIYSIPIFRDEIELFFKLVHLVELLKSVRHGDEPNAQWVKSGFHHPFHIELADYLSNLVIGLGNQYDLFTGLVKYLTSFGYCDELTTYYFKGYIRFPGKKHDMKAFIMMRNIVVHYFNSLMTHKLGGGDVKEAIRLLDFSTKFSDLIFLLTLKAKGTLFIKESDYVNGILVKLSEPKWEKVIVGGQAPPTYAGVDLAIKAIWDIPGEDDKDC